MKKLALASLIALSTGACVWEKNMADRPARLQMGLNTRHIDTPIPQQPANALGGYAVRTTTPPSPEDKSVMSDAVTGSMQFTMSGRYHTYMGAEVEAGTLGRSGSNLGAMYGVFGAEQASKLGSISAEMVGGRRWLRYEIGDEDVGYNALEARVRGQFWLGPQVSLGGMIGANAVPGESGWMAGVYIGIFSSEYNTWAQRR